MKSRPTLGAISVYEVQVLEELTTSGVCSSLLGAENDTTTLVCDNVVV